MSLASTDAYYDAAGAVEVVRSELVKHPKLQIAARKARVFGRRVEDAELWGPYRRILRQTIWDLLNTPLPMDNQTLDLRSAGDRLAGIATGLQERSTPALISDAIALGRDVGELAVDSSDPLGGHARDLLGAGSPECSVLVVRDRSYRGAVESHFHTAGCPVRVVVPAEVPEMDVVETMILVGQAKHYPDHLLNAPRARQLCVLRYEWLRDILRVESLLPAQRTPPVRSAVTPTMVEDDFLEPGIEGIDWSALRAAPARDDGLGDHGSDAHQARLYVLAGGNGVYLESEPGSTVLCIDPDTGRGGGSVQRLETSRVEPGNIIVLRRDFGGGDFIEDVANRLLGTQAAPLRAVQAQWTQALRDTVGKQGVAGVERDLEGIGVRARNVRYWMSSHSIRTASIDDFRIVMGYVGLTGRADEIWGQMGRLDSAHRRAGQRIRRMLLRQVREADPAEINREGLMDFELGDDYAGVLTAFRVEAKSPDIVEEVPGSRLRDPFRLGRGYWLE